MARETFHTFGATLALLTLVTLQAAAQSSLQKPGTKPPAEGGATSGSQDLSSQATDPTAALMSISVLGEATTSYWDSDDSGFTMKFQPAVPFKAWGTSNVMRIVVPYQTTGPGDEGLKSVSILDVVIVPQKWGRLAIGPVMSLAESAGSAESKFSIGPAVGGVHSVSKRLTIGLFSQNLFASHTAISQLQPIVAFQLGHGWAISAGDLQFTYDWKLGEWVLIPFGAQLGVVQHVGRQPFRFAVTPLWNTAHIQGADKFKIIFTVALLAPAG